MATSIKEGLNYIIQAIQNMIEPQLDKLRYDRTYRAKVLEKVKDGVYRVQINGSEYQIKYNGNLNIGSVVKVKAPLNNFSDIYPETISITNISELNNDSQFVLCFNNVIEMKAYTEFKVGMCVKTLGYYTKGDGGSATYEIVLSSSIPDDSYLILLNNGLKAKLVVENNSVNILQLGAQKLGRDNVKHDIQPYVLRYIAHLNTLDYVEKLYIPTGVYNCSELTLSRNKGFYIYGDGALQVGAYKTIITAMGDQDFVIRLGRYEERAQNFTFTDLVISSTNYVYKIGGTVPTALSYYKISTAALRIGSCAFATFGNLGFDGIDGVAMMIDTSWECFFNILNFENINAHGRACLVFNTTNLQYWQYNNMSDSNFEYLRFEQFTGNAIQFNDKCLTLNMHFGTINVEPSECKIGYTYQKNINDVTLADYNAVFNFNGTDPSAVFQVDCIQLNNVLDRYYTKDGKNYAFGTIINAGVKRLYITATISNVTLHYSGKSLKLIENHGESSHFRTTVIFDNIANNSNYDMIADVTNFANLKIKNYIGKYDTPIGTQSGFIPCINNYKRDKLQYTGLITYDPLSLNTNHLVIRTRNDLTSTGKNIMQFILGEKFYIIAKIDNGKTLKVRLQSTDNLFYDIGVLDMVGVGTYKLYEIPITNTSYIGKLVSLGMATNNDTVIGSFDSFKT